MALSLKIISKADTDNGFVVEFEGYQDEEKILDNALHFSRFSTPKQVLEVCMEEVQAAVAPLPDSPDLSAMLAQEYEVDPELGHPLYGVDDPAQAKSRVESLIAARLERLISESGLVDRYPGVERDTWGRQIEEALNYKEGRESAFIAGVANTRAGETPEMFADSILNNASEFLAAAAPLFKSKHELACALDALPDEVPGIKEFYDNQVLNWSV
ncbi:hypothetical protein [Dethiosulfatarculus sandiegensis]|uniref:Uncharacterized protein n=1 Tax=Dethiosulfatarculus sandiegensis TaxID=1429043 RepID=A0A0D2JFC8_9BACT|nr:hypothetical protein [Dethiosulfatarculus sandiegensis]KIX14416.1 hypothetical protein X474_09740 [Dethiosulfatarculus sandiegensis]